MEVRLDGRVLLVTGGGAGIGRAIALLAGRAGAEVAVLDRDPVRADRVADEVAALGRRALGLAVDVRESAALAEAVARAADHFGRLDVLVNNAGGTVPRSFLAQSERAWRRTIDLNLTSALCATAAAVSHIAASGGGAVLNVASIEGLRAAPGYAVYGACKAALIQLTRTWALEFAGLGVRVNAIAPDFVLTPGTVGEESPADPADWCAAHPDAARRIARRIPLGRPGSAEECARVALFLVSPAAAYLNGVVVPVDGGTWASGGWLRDGRGGWSLGGDGGGPDTRSET
ncbi:MAG: 3-oxoacyl-[acyl-carrier-protein] reductase FabG [Porticoccaceae bacterium]|nr:MAG: 3-oxoacyl-[acyl-carrier-protein] reductase FabG [Porticoccaceae bacterium]